MMLGWYGAVTCLLLLLQLPEAVYSKKQIVKLIVPHKIKYIHHTHVLLVKPIKKKSSKIREHEETIEEDGPTYEHFYRDSSRGRSKPQVHYVLPIVSETKEGRRSYAKPPKREHNEEDEPYILHMENHPNKRTPSEEIHPSPNGKGKSAHRGLRVPYDDDMSSSFQKARIVYDPPSYSEQHPSFTHSLVKKPPYHVTSQHYEETAATNSLQKPHYIYKKPTSEESSFVPSIVSKPYQTIPQQYETDYLGSYDSYSEMDPSTLSPEEGGWGSNSFSIPEKSSMRAMYKGNPYYEQYPPTHPQQYK